MPLPNSVNRRLAVAFMTVSALAVAAPAAASNYDLVIHDARVIDGSGKPAFRGDVAVRGDTIVAVSRHTLHGRRTIDARGRVLTPGFIDSHAHGDPLESDMHSFLSQGVTLIVLGQDGQTPGASTEDDETSGLDFPAWTRAVDAHGLHINVAALTGFGTLRKLAGIDSSPIVTPEQQAEMRGQLQSDMDAGSFGMSSGLEYVPDRYGSTAELVDLAQVVGRNGGVIESHMRSEDDDKIEGAIDELIAQGRYARVHISHIKVVSGHGVARGEAVVRKIDEANAAGVRLSADVYPYTAGFADLSLVYPAWAKRESEFKDAVLNRRAELEEAIRVKVMGRNGPAAILVSSGPDKGLTVEQAAAKAGKPFAAYIVDAGYGGPAAAHFVMDDATQEAFIRGPRVAFSTDGSPGMRHPRAWASYARIIEEFVEKRHDLTLEAAVRKATGYPARDILGLRDRGFIAVGMKADLVLFDPKHVHAAASWLAPSEVSQGFDLVMVNGRAAWEDGHLTTTQAGRLLRRPGSGPHRRSKP